MKIQVINPEPFLQISLECAIILLKELISTKFNEAINALGLSVDFLNDHAFTSHDFEGDIYQVTVENCEETKEFLKLIFESFKIEHEIPETLNIVFTP
jgi:hypothetical protein